MKSRFALEREMADEIEWCLRLPNGSSRTRDRLVELCNQYVARHELSGHKTQPSLPAVSAELIAQFK